MKTIKIINKKYIAILVSIFVVWGMMGITKMAQAAFTITKSAGFGGKIDPPGEEIPVTSGDDVAFTITPNTNYCIKIIKVDDQPIAITNKFLMTYTFNNVISNGHKIEAIFKILGNINDDNTVGSANFSGDAANADLMLII